MMRKTRVEDVFHGLLRAVAGGELHPVAMDLATGMYLRYASGPRARWGMLRAVMYVALWNNPERLETHTRFLETEETPPARFLPTRESLVRPEDVGTIFPGIVNLFRHCTSSLPNPYAETWQHCRRWAFSVARTGCACRGWALATRQQPYPRPNYIPVDPERLRQLATNYEWKEIL